MQTVNNYSLQIHGPYGITRAIKLKKALSEECLVLLDALTALNKDYRFTYQEDKAIHMRKHA